jgi:hypothetical protein
MEVVDDLAVLRLGAKQPGVVGDIAVEQLRWAFNCKLRPANCAVVSWLVHAEINSV